MIKSRDLIFMQDYNHCDTIILKQHGCDLTKSLVYNLIDMHHIINETAEHSLEKRVAETFNDDYKTRLKGQYTNLEYQGKDGIYTYRLGMLDLQALTEANCLNLYDHVRKTSLALLKTELEGIKINVDLLKSVKLETEKKIKEFLPLLREEFKGECDVWELKKWSEEIDKRTSDRGKQNVQRPEFNFASDTNLKTLLYGKEYLGLAIKEKTKKGNPSTSYDTLNGLVNKYPRIRNIVKYKEVKSIYGTFIKGLEERVENGRIYPHFNVSGTDTGRISHSNPNLANLPTDGPIRNFFIPDTGRSIVGADYSQLEVVVEANLTHDPNTLKIILDGASKHDITAHGLGIPRDVAKTLNFALQYGAGTDKVSKILAISRTEAQRVFDKYWDLYPGARRLKERTNKDVEQFGYVKNIFGRTRHFPKANNKFELFRQQRQAWNFKIQGPASDMTNMASYLIQDYLVSNDYGRLLFTVHDEVVCEVRNDYVQQSIQGIINCMGVPNAFLNLKYIVTCKPYGPLQYWSKT